MTDSMTPSKIVALFSKELRELAATRSFWVMLLVLCPLVGFSFVEAVFLYGQAGETVLGDEILMGRLSPLDGIFIPTFSALYLSEVFLLPFVVIRLLGVEKQFGSLKFLLQICPSVALPLSVKALVAMLAFFVSLVPAVTAVAVWHHMGGHLYLPEVMILLFGHFLFAFLITAIAFFAVAITDSPQTAAIVTLAFTISSWVLEFAGQNQSTLSLVSWLSMTAHLRLFEAALFSLQTVLGFLIAGVFFITLSVIWLKTSESLSEKCRRSVLTTLIAAGAGLIAHQSFYFHDFSENRINSFNPRNEAELRKLNKPLKITIHLNQDHSAAVDFERNFLSKLRRVVKDVAVIYKPPKDVEGVQVDPNFGLITYDYNGVQIASHDVGPFRALEVLHFLTGTRLEGEVQSVYPGYPLKADAGKYRILFYLIMPICIILAWIVSQKCLKTARGEVTDGAN